MSMQDAIKAAILKRHQSFGFLRQDGKWGYHQLPVFFELRIGTGRTQGAEQRIDAFALHPYPSLGHHRTAYEIKVSRSDFLRELKKPNKRRAALRFSNEFYFIAPPAIIHRSEVPLECGLIEVGTDGIGAVVVPAPCRDSMPPTWGFIASIIGRVSGGK